MIAGLPQRARAAPAPSLSGRPQWRSLQQHLGGVVAIPLAAGALYAWGVLLTPALGAALMSASTVIVAVNARLLRLKASSGGREREPGESSDPKREVGNPMPKNKNEA